MINLDLRNLTDARIAEAMPHIGQCRYIAPCILGALVPEDQRARLDNEDDQLGDDLGEHMGIGAIARRGHVQFPDDRQLFLAENLQAAFDRGRLSDVKAQLTAIREEFPCA